MIEDVLPPPEREVMPENFTQALHFVNTSVGPATIPSNVREILNDEKCRNLTQEVGKCFWL